MGTPMSQESMDWAEKEIAKIIKKYGSLGEYHRVTSMKLFSEFKKSELQK